MHPLRQGIYPALFTGKSRKESAWFIVQLRLQAEAHEDVRVRGVRTHRQRSGGTLRTLAGQPPTQPGSTQVLRQEAVQILQ